MYSKYYVGLLREGTGGIRESKGLFLAMEL